MHPLFLFVDIIFMIVCLLMVAWAMATENYLPLLFIVLIIYWFVCLRDKMGI